MLVSLWQHLLVENTIGSWDSMAGLIICGAFFLRKRVTANIMMNFVKELKPMHGINVKFIHCDNTETKAFKNLCKKNGLGLFFEFLAPNTPQQNGQVEHKFETLFGRVHSMLNGRNSDLHWRTIMWAEAANTATALENNAVMVSDGMSAFCQFFEEEDKRRVQKSILYSLENIGEKCIITSHKKLKQIWIFRQNLVFGLVMPMAISLTLIELSTQRCKA